MNTVHDLMSSHLALVKEWESQPFASAARKDTLSRLNAQVPALNQMLSELGPDVGQISGYAYGRRPVIAPEIYRALELLYQADSFKAECRVAGIPALPMSSLHPRVAEAAQPLFEAQKCTARPSTTPPPTSTRPSRRRSTASTSPTPT